MHPGVGEESRELLANGEEDVNRGVVIFLDASFHDIGASSVSKSYPKPEARQSYFSGGGRCHKQRCNRELLVDAEPSKPPRSVQRLISERRFSLNMDSLGLFAYRAFVVVYIIYKSSAF